MSRFVLGCAVVAILAFAGNVNAAITKGTLSWQIEVTAFFSYKLTSDRDNMLQQILDLWKSNFDDKYQLYDEKITVVKELEGPEGFEEFKQLTFRINGKGPSGTNIQSLVSQFSSKISSASIPGVQLNLSDSSTGSLTTFNVDVQANFAYSSSADRDRLLQQILDLFKNQFVTYGFANLKIAVVSEQPSEVDGAKLLTFRISGQSSSDIDIKDLNTKFMAAIKTSKISGITLPTTSNEDGTGNRFTLEDTITLRFLTQADRDRLLQQILLLWNQAYGSKYGIINPQITITGPVKPSTTSTGSFVVTYTITGISTTPVDETNIKIDFNKVLSNAKITGVIVREDDGQTGGEGNDGDSSTGDEEVTDNTDGADGRDLCGTVSVNQINGRTITKGSFSTNFTVYLTYKRTTIRNDKLQKLLAIWGDILEQATKLKMCYYSQVLRVGRIEGKLIVNKVIYGLSGIATATFNTADVAKTFEEAVANSDIKNVFFTTDFGDCSVKPAPDTNSFTITVSVAVSYKTQTELNTILQRILKLWIQKYGSVNGATRVTIKVTSTKPNPLGGHFITIAISGFSNTVIDVTKFTKEFITVLSSSKIAGVKIPGVTETPFTFDFTVIATYVNEAQFGTILSRVMGLWIKTFGKSYGVDGEKTIISGTPDETSTKNTYRLHYQMNGVTTKGTFDVDRVTSKFKTVLTENPIPGVTLPDDEEPASTSVAPVPETEAPEPEVTTAPGIVEGGTDNDMELAFGRTFDFKLTVYITTNKDAKTSAKLISTVLNEILSVWMIHFGTNYDVTEHEIHLVGQPEATTVDGVFKVTFSISGRAKVQVTADELITKFKAFLAGGAVGNVSVELPSETEDSGNETGESEGGTFEVSENQQHGKTVGPGKFDVTLTVYLAYDTSAIRENFLERLLVIWRNSLNDYQVTDLKLSFVKEQLNVGKLSAKTGGLTVNKVWYRITGNTKLAFNTATVSKVFEQTVVDAHLGGVTFALGGKFGTQS